MAQLFQDMLENIVGNVEILVTSISPFSTMFSKDFIPRVVNSHYCAVLGELTKCNVLVAQYKDNSKCNE